MGQAVPEDDLPSSLSGKEVSAGDLPENLSGGAVPAEDMQGPVSPYELAGPQALTIGRELAPVAGRAALEVGKRGVQAVANLPVGRTAADIAGVMSHGVPWGTVVSGMRNANPTTVGEVVGKAKDILKAAPGAMTSGARNVGGALVRGALAPESLFALPYQMAAYEQAKIRENPYAPGLEKNPYAMMIRGEAPTQGAAGAMNMRQAVASAPTGYTPTPQEAENILSSGDERMINIYGGRLKLQGLASPGPNAVKSGFDQELNNLARKRQLGR